MEYLHTHQRSLVKYNYQDRKHFEDAWKGGDGFEENVMHIVDCCLQSFDHRHYFNDLQSPQQPRGLGYSAQLSQSAYFGTPEHPEAAESSVENYGEHHQREVELVSVVCKVIEDAQPDYLYDTFGHKDCYDHVINCLEQRIM